MKDTEFLKYMRSFDISEQMISKEEAFAYIKMLNQDIGQVDMVNMKYDVYKKMLVQVAMHIYTVKKWEDLTWLNPSIIF